MIPVRTVFVALLLQVSLIILHGCSADSNSSVGQDADTSAVDANDATDAEVENDLVDAADAVPDTEGDTTVDVGDGSCDVGNVRQVCESGQGCVGGICAPCQDASHCSDGEGCLNGVCGACSAPEQCRVGEACRNGVCGPCTVSGDCAGGLGCLDGACAPCQKVDHCNGRLCTDGVCAPCTDDAHCEEAYGEGFLCGNGLCFPESCGSDVDCMPAKTICSKETFVCTPCLSSIQCVESTAYGQGFQCLGGVCTQGNCLSSAECPEDEPVCSQSKTCRGCKGTVDGAHAECIERNGPGWLCLASGACVAGECIVSPDCGTINKGLCGIGEGGSDNPYLCRACVDVAEDAACKQAYGLDNLICQDGQCVGACAPNAACSEAGVCSPSGRCEPCSSDTACNAAYSSNYICVEGGCIKGDCHTDDDCILQSQVCIANICSACGPAATCYQGFECVGGLCLPIICDPAEVRCSGDFKTVEVCNGTGTGWEFQQSCQAPGACRGGQCLTECQVASFDRDYVGCEFWAVDLDNEIYGTELSFAIVVFNVQDSPVNITVYGYGSAILDSASVAAKGTHVFSLPHTGRVTGPGIFQSGYRLLSDRPVLASQVAEYGTVLTYSNDASILLPTGALGNSYMGLSMPSSGRYGGGAQPPIKTPGSLVVVATQQGETKVSVKLTCETLGGNGISVGYAGQVQEYSLQRYEVLALQSAETLIDIEPYACDDDPWCVVAPQPGLVCDDPPICSQLEYTYATGPDMTGTTIEADKAVAVFGGHKCSMIPVGKWACDHLQHIMLPMEAWGTEYVAVKTQPRNAEVDLFRIVASQDGTLVSWDGDETGSAELNAGQVHEIWTDGDFVVESNRPIAVGQYLVGEEADAGIGDPSMMLLAANSQWRLDYVFQVPPGYTSNFVTIIAPTGTNMTLDTIVLDSMDFELVHGDMRRIRIPIGEGGHTLKATKPVGLYVYGYSDYISYAYLGGLGIQ